MSSPVAKSDAPIWMKCRGASWSPRIARTKTQTPDRGSENSTDEIGRGDVVDVERQQVVAETLADLGWTERLEQEPGASFLDRR